MECFSSSLVPVPVCPGLLTTKARHNAVRESSLEDVHMDSTCMLQIEASYCRQQILAEIGSCNSSRWAALSSLVASRYRINV